MFCLSFKVSCLSATVSYLGFYIEGWFGLVLFLEGFFYGVVFFFRMGD